MDTIITLLIAAMVIFAGALLIGCDADDADDTDSNDPKDNKEAQENDEIPSLEVNPNLSLDEPLQLVEETEVKLTSFELCTAIVETGILAADANFQTVGNCVDWLDIGFSTLCSNYKAFMHCSETCMEQPGTDAEFIGCVTACSYDYCM